jgi:ribonuclease HI
MQEHEILEIYVDGSVFSGRGGLGVRVLSLDEHGNEIVHDFQSAGYLNANSGQMEIVACSFALREVMDRQYILGKKHLTIITDSKYVADHYRYAMFHWINSKWSWPDGRPVLDATEWKELVKQIRLCWRLGTFVEIKWMPGHSKNRHNDAVHKLANESARLPTELLPKNGTVLAFRPEPIQAEGKFQIGSVRMDGQRVSIKILHVEYLASHKLWSCKYKVVSPKSPYFSRVDRIFTQTSLDAGKTYHVKFNRDTKNPRVEKVYRETRLLKN